MSGLSDGHWPGNSILAISGDYALLDVGQYDICLGNDWLYN